MPPVGTNQMKSGDKMEETNVTIRSIQSMSKANDFYKKKKATRVMVTPEPVTPKHQNAADPEFADILNPKKIRVVNGKPYLIIQKIGKGGSSKVYKVLSPEADVYALKQVDISGVNDYVVQSFKNEIKLLQMLQHSDRIIKLIDSEIDRRNDTVMIVLEAGDIDLASLIAKNRTENEEIDPNFLRIMWQQMLEAVQTVHDAKVIHGDLKPANFLFVGGTLKLIDFGIAMSITPGLETTSMERAQSVGTVNYMSPESLIARPVNGHESKIKQGRPADVWSLGCILYQLVYNRPAFPQTDMFEKVTAICDNSYEIEFPLVEDREDFVALSHVMRLCLQRDPKQRPTIKELLNHEYITLRQKDIEDELLRFVLAVQDKYPDFDFESDEGHRKLLRVKKQLIDGEQISLD